MGFEKILTVKKYDHYIDFAFKNATRKAKSMTIRKGSTIEKKKTRELAKILTVKNTLNDQLSSIVKSFPSFEKDLTDFYKDLIKITIGLGELRKSLGAVNWARKKVNEVFRVYNTKIKNTSDINLMVKYRN